MFYNPENSRGWIVEAVYANDPASKILDQMHNDPEAPGESDIGIRNLLYTMILNLRPRRVLEIGCHIGSGAIVIGAALRRNSYGQLFTLEPAPHYQKIAQSYVEKANLEKIVRILPLYSYQPECREILGVVGPFDLIFIDGAHEYDAAVADIQLSTDLLHDNGIIILHDTGRISPEIDQSKKGGVRKALHDFHESHPTMKAIYFEHPLWLNPCGAAMLCKQVYEPPIECDEANSARPVIVHRRVV